MTGIILDPSAWAERLRQYYDAEGPEYSGQVRD